MEVRSLQNTPLNTIVDCLLISFEDYFVPMPTQLSYWEDRFKGARVDLGLSFGCFEQEQLVGFIINGIDDHQGKLTAFNTGTGVIPSHRGKKVVDQIYDFALPILQKAGVQKCALEVVQINDRAVRVYERIGFHITKKFLCFKGQLPAANERLEVQAIPFSEVVTRNTPFHDYYSWDNMNAAVITADSLYTTYLVRDQAGEEVGYFTMNLKNGYLAQYESFQDDFNPLLKGISQIRREVRINNVDIERADVIIFLLAAGLDNHIDQFEMEMGIGGG